MFNLFGGKDPFDDPFFTHPFGGAAHEKNSGRQSSKELTIEELDSDGNPLKSDIIHPNKEQLSYNNNPNLNGRTEKRSFSYQRVSYGGLNGTYYTSSVTKKSGGDGVVFMEVNEDDKTIGEALHTVSRGINDKGHSVTTKRNSDGKKDTLQTLHNINQDELDMFEQKWKDNAGYLPDLNSELYRSLENAEPIFRGGWALPPTEGHKKNDDGGNSSTKKVTRINVE
ncbi:uncharacterized protein LOC124945985 [Impatiens glandulifera]|uniref:uncharacterized protein LOC124945985 n=1 Tax=Impatiens glandulifera TaxID=253017 RepID=UPI001FB198AD|nr:uncharacterized protein LOC124945985 [Impatiens glandulifera]